MESVIICKITKGEKVLFWYLKSYLFLGSILKRKIDSYNIKCIWYNIILLYAFIFFLSCILLYNESIILMSWIP